MESCVHPAPADHSINRRPCVWAAVGSAPLAAAASPRGVPPAPPRLHHPAAPPGRPPAPASPPAALPPPPCPAPAASLTREVALLLATRSRSATPIHSRASPNHSLQHHMRCHWRKALGGPRWEGSRPAPPITVRGLPRQLQGPVASSQGPLWAPLSSPPAADSTRPAHGR